MRRVMVAACVVGLSGCELTEITIADPETVLIAEVYVNLGANPADHAVLAYLHRTIGSPNEALPPLSDAMVTVTRADGLSIVLVETDIDDCLNGLLNEFRALELGACHVASAGAASSFRPGDTLEVTVDAGGEEVLLGVTRLPGDFEIDGALSTCRLTPDTLMPLRWSRAEGAWAYFNETFIQGLRLALEPEQIPVEQDPLYLLGLSISDADTTIVFPSEFGVFSRFDLDQALTVRLQRGLPAEVTSEVTINAVDRNFVNWVRGGNFNPSGQVRVPSLRGGGTGVFGSSVVRRFHVVSSANPIPGLPDCPVPPPL
ncbi:MAG: hypothetical protein O2958_00365 [Gemmatimonadetes bacterium]|nr:hypothetical protein [Gemmatimonadota bacterium]MDA1102748.1 hypothetical protein [Gemmatimonadota bacterium]